MKKIYQKKYICSTSFLFLLVLFFLGLCEMHSMRANMQKFSQFFFNDLLRREGMLKDFTAKIKITGEGESTSRYNLALLQYSSADDWKMVFFPQNPKEPQKVEQSTSKKRESGFSYDTGSILGSLVMEFFFPFSRKHEMSPLLCMYERADAKFSIHSPSEDSMELIIVWNCYKEVWKFKKLAEWSLNSVKVYEKEFLFYKLLSSTEYRFEKDPYPYETVNVPAISYATIQGGLSLKLELVDFSFVEMPDELSPN